MQFETRKTRGFVDLVQVVTPGGQVITTIAEIFDEDFFTVLPKALQEYFDHEREVAEPLERGACT